MKTNKIVNATVLMSSVVQSKPESKLKRLLRTLRNRSKVTSLLISGASWSFITSVCGTGLFFGAHVLIARLIGPKSYGHYFYTLTVINFLALFCKLGLDTAIVRFVPVYRAHSEWALLRGFHRRVKQVSLLVSMSCSVVTAVVTLFIYNHIEGELAHTFMIACIVLPVNVLMEIFGSTLQALKRILFSQVPSEIIRPIVLASLTFCSLSIIGLNPQAPTIMAIECISIVIALLASTYFVRNSLPSRTFEVEAKYRTRTWIKTAVPLLLISSSRIILKQSDIIMVGLFLGTTNAGVYGVASRVAMLLGFGLNAIQRIAAPMTSELYSQGKMKELQRMVSLAACGSVIFSILAAAIIITFGRFILGLFGTTFVAGYVALLILLAGQFIGSFSGITGALMSMTGHQKQASQIALMSVVSNIFLNIVLIPVLGIIGAAVSTSIAIALWNISMLVYIRNKLGIDTTIISLVKANK